MSAFLKDRHILRIAKSAYPDGLPEALRVLRDSPSSICSTSSAPKTAEERGLEQTEYIKSRLVPAFDAPPVERGCPPFGSSVGLRRALTCGRLSAGVQP